MRTVLFSLLFVQLFIGCNKSIDKQNGENDTETKLLPRIAIAGLSIESSTFSPALTHFEAFQVNTGDDIYKLYPFLSSDSLNRMRAIWIPILRARSLHGGIEIGRASCRERV